MTNFLVFQFSPRFIFYHNFGNRSTHNQLIFFKFSPQTKFEFVINFISFIFIFYIQIRMVCTWKWRKNTIESFPSPLESRIFRAIKLMQHKVVCNLCMKFSDGQTCVGATKTNSNMRSNRRRAIPYHTADISTADFLIPSI